MDRRQERSIKESEETAITFSFYEAEDVDVLGRCR